jgi:uncharacterized delta-60 repeat protein
MRLFGSHKSRSTTSSRRRSSSFRPHLEALEDRCVPSAPGTLDTSFGSGGIVTTSLGKSSTDIAFAAAVQSDGKIVAAGTSSTSSANYLDVARYNPNGTLDSSFGSGGKVQTKFSFSDYEGSLVIQPDGKILVGYTVNGDFELVRYNPNGTLDKTFNGTGEVSTAFPPNAAGLIGVALESVNGVTEIVAAGHNTFSDGHFGIALARYNLNGNLDTTFGSGGKVVTDLGYDIDLWGLAIQGDGNIVVAGSNNSSSTYLVARYGSSGNLDPTFGNGGVATGAVSGYAGAVLVQPDGKIVAGGAYYSSHQQAGWALERLNSDGSLDTTFGTGGVVDGPFTIARIHGLALQANGKLVAAGTGGSGFDLARYNSDGSPDTTFGTNGQVITTINGGSASLALTLQADGKIIAAGDAPKSTTNSNHEFALARYWGDPVPVIGSFTANHNPVTSGSNLTLTASNLTDANTSSSITQVAFYVDSSTGNGKLDTSDTLLGYATQTSPGVWTFTFTVNLTAGTYTLFAQAEDSLGIFSYTDTLTLTVQ